MQQFTEMRTEVREREHIKKSSHLQRLIFHFQPNLQSVKQHACREDEKEGEKNQRWYDLRGEASIRAKGKMRDKGWVKTDFYTSKTKIEKRPQHLLDSDHVAAPHVAETFHLFSI